MLPCLTLKIIRYGSRVKWRNPGKGVAPFPTPWCSSYWKGSLRVTLDYGRQLYLLTYLQGLVVRLRLRDLFVFVILQDRFYVVHIPLVRAVKFKFLAQLPVDNLAHPVVSISITLEYFKLRNCMQITCITNSYLKL